MVASCWNILLQLASLNAWGIFKHYVKDVYMVLAVCVHGKVGMHKPYPLCFLFKCGKSLPVSKVCFCWGFGGCGTNAINVCKKSVKFQPCAITRKPSCTHGASFYIESIGISTQNIVVYISVIYYCSALKLATPLSYI